MSVMRPTFELEVPVGLPTVLERFQGALKNSTWQSTSLTFGNYAELHVPPQETRCWSPHLSLYFEGDERTTRILGRFGPRQEIWTLVCLVYLALAFSAFFALMYCIALWMIGQFTWWFIVPPMAIGGIGLLYLMSRVGQGWSSDQLQMLRAEFNELFEIAYPTQRL